jgi:hypothetical protein
MTIELSQDEVALLIMMLSKAEVETRVEIHHSKSFEYKDYLKARDKLISDLLARLKT